MNSDPNVGISRNLDLTQCPGFSDAKLQESEDLALRIVLLGLLLESMFFFSKVGIMICPVPTSQVGSKNQLKGCKRTYKCSVSEVGNVFLSGAAKIPTISKKKKWQPTPLFLPGKSHGQRSLAGYSSWGHKESDTTSKVNNNSNSYHNYLIRTPIQKMYRAPTNQ